MSCVCKGICHRGYEIGGIGYQGRFHQDGHVLCRTCSRFMKYDGIFCPCCANRVSRKSKCYKRVSKISTVLNNVKGIWIIMVRKTIHITQEQTEWLDDNAYNVSRLVRKVSDKIINDENARAFFSHKIKTKSN